MKDLLISLFGDYEPVLTVADIAGEQVEVVASGFAGVDWPWIMGVFLFAIVLYSFFRIVGCFFK